MSEPKLDLSKGLKLDNGKPQLSLIPREALLECGNAMTYGAKKYAAHNYKKGIEYSRLIDAALRHLIAYNDGENNDTESGLSHLGHALASVAMLTYMHANHPEMDNRFHRYPVRTALDHMSRGSAVLGTSAETNEVSQLQHELKGK